MPNFDKQQMEGTEKLVASFTAEAQVEADPNYTVYPCICAR